MRKPFSIRLSWVVATLFALSPLQALAANLTYSRYYYQPPGAPATRIPRVNDGGWRLLDQQHAPQLTNNQTTTIPDDASYATATTTINNTPLS